MWCELSFNTDKHCKDRPTLTSHQFECIVSVHSIGTNLIENGNSSVSLMFAAPRRPGGDINASTSVG